MDNIETEYKKTMLESITTMQRAMNVFLDNFTLRMDQLDVEIKKLADRLAEVKG